MASWEVLLPELKAIMNQCICWFSVPQNLVPPQPIFSLHNHVICVALDGVDIAILHLFHDAYMVNGTIQAILVIPAEENDISRLRHIVPFIPKTTRFEPVHALVAG